VFVPSFYVVMQKIEERRGGRKDAPKGAQPDGAASPS